MTFKKKLFYGPSVLNLNNVKVGFDSLWNVIAVKILLKHTGNKVLRNESVIVLIDVLVMSNNAKAWNE